MSAQAELKDQACLSEKTRADLLKELALVDRKMAELVRVRKAISIVLEIGETRAVRPIAVLGELHRAILSIALNLKSEFTARHVVEEAERRIVLIRGRSITHLMVGPALCRLHDCGKLVRVGVGRYVLPSATAEESATANNGIAD